MEQINMYGILNCDAVKKAKTWFAENNLEVTFHDYKKEGIDKKLLTAWCSKVGWQILINKKGTTWRKLSEAEQEAVTNKTAAISIMLKNNSLIKRPVISFGEKIVVGYNQTELEQTFLHHKK